MQTGRIVGLFVIFGTRYESNPLFSYIIMNYLFNITWRRCAIELCAVPVTRALCLICILQCWYIQSLSDIWTKNNYWRTQLVFDLHIINTSIKNSIFCNGPHVDYRCHKHYTRPLVIQTCRIIPISLNSEIFNIMDTIVYYLFER